MYDPKRNEAAGFVEDLRKQRHARALKLHNTRSELRKAGYDVRQSNSWARQTANFYGYSSGILRADPKSLRMFALAKWNYAEEPIGYNGNEYYTCCGLDDYQAERKDYAHSLALEIWRTVGRF